MPTYDYECEKCGYRYELFQSMKDEPKKRCPKCKGKVRRLIGAGAGMIFKGSGFYVTDYRSDSYKNQKKSETSEGSKSESKSESQSKSESKSESQSKSESKSESQSKPESKSESKPDARKPEQPAPKAERKRESDGPKQKKKDSS